LARQPILRGIGSPGQSGELVPPVDPFNGVVILGGMVVALPEGKKLISTAEAAKILGVSMGRVRQLAGLDPKDGGLESWLAAPTARVFDEAAVRKLAKSKKTTGRPKGGFQAN